MSGKVLKIGITNTKGGEILSVDKVDVEEVKQKILIHFSSLFEADLV